MKDLTALKMEEVEYLIIIQDLLYNEIELTESETAEKDRILQKIEEKKKYAKR